MPTVIHWFRRDLRVTDNVALHAASLRAGRVIPLFILEDAFRTGPDVGAARLAFLFQSLEVLRRNLEHLGHRLIIRHGKSEEILPKFVREVGASAVFANKRYEPYGQARDKRVAAALYEQGIGFELFKDAVAWEEREILNLSGAPYTVYTPYSKAWKARPVPAPVPRLGPAAGAAPPLASDPLILDPAELGFPLKQTLPAAGERAAKDLLDRFLAGPVLRYDTERNFPAVDGTSSLSPHLRAGTIGIRTVLARLAAVREAADERGRRGCDIWLNELIWREFYQQVLHNFPHVLKGCFRPEYDALAWSDDEAHFLAWCAGQTGYPIVDAAMRCLAATGTMHNRLRMIVAMFLTKDLLLSWRRGERWFMQQLVDGDLAANNGGWQWSAGTGTDAAPYFRIFNPVSQGEKFDPEGAFVRRWVPELASLPNDTIHQPWEEPFFSPARFKYPARIVLHDEQRPKCLAMFKAVKGK
jgi:deoxyribodipyrimidine photo-lyase